SAIPARLPGRRPVPRWRPDGLPCRVDQGRPVDHVAGPGLLALAQPNPDQAPQHPPLRGLTSIQDGTEPGGGDRLADPTMAARPIGRRSVAFPNPGIPRAPPLTVAWAPAPLWL